MLVRHKIISPSIHPSIYLSIYEKKFFELYVFQTPKFFLFGVTRFLLLSLCLSLLGIILPKEGKRTSNDMSSLCALFLKELEEKCQVEASLILLATSTESDIVEENFDRCSENIRKFLDGKKTCISYSVLSHHKFLATKLKFKTGPLDYLEIFKK